MTTRFVINVERSPSDRLCHFLLLGPNDWALAWVGLRPGGTDSQLDGWSLLRAWLARPLPDPRSRATASDAICQDPSAIVRRSSGWAAPGRQGKRCWHWD